MTRLLSSKDSQQIFEARGISELVRDRIFRFDTVLDKEISVIRAADTKLLADTSTGYRRTKLVLETHLREAPPTDDNIWVAHQGAFDHANYQWQPTLKALKLPRARILIADAVGLGKTIETGILLAELTKRGRGKRILVLGLKSILAQFQQEIWHRFAIPLVRLDSVGLARISAKLPANKNPFDYYDKTIISIDTLKSNAKFRHYIERSHWDVVVIDECHTVANVRSHRGDLAQFLAKRCESLILTSATPHNGKRENFANLIQYLEPIAVGRTGDLDPEKIAPYFIRRFKHDVAQEVGKNFRERELRRVEVDYSPEEEEFLRFRQGMKLREAQTEERGRGREHFFSINLFKGFLSSPAAALLSVREKIGRIQDRPKTNDELTDEEVEALDQLETAQSLLRVLIPKGTEKKPDYAATLHDAKYDALRQMLKEIHWDGSVAAPRVVVFAERIETLRYLNVRLRADFRQNFVKQRADQVFETVAIFDGSLGDTEQQSLIESFGSGDSNIRLLLTSDAGAQGVNLHYHCHHMVNYDIPWSLITLQQRNGRIDRYGQQHTPYIYYLVGQTSDPELQTDLYIIDRLAQKEEEVKNTIGDPGAVTKLYDSKAEEQLTERAILNGNADFLETSVLAEDEDFDAFFDNLLDEVTTQSAADDALPNPLHKHEGFYANDVDYYTALLTFLQRESQLELEAEFSNGEMLSVMPTPDLDRILYDLPPEAKPAHGDRYRLLTDPNAVQRAIDEARHHTDTWAKFQLLYDLHPLATYLRTALHSTVPKGTAYVVRTEVVPTDRYFFIFYGSIVNRLGRPILAEHYVVGLDGEGGVREQPVSLTEFLNRYQLNEEIYVRVTTEEELQRLDRLKMDAIEFMETVYFDNEVVKEKMRIEAQMNRYEDQLRHWQENDPNQPNLPFAAEKRAVYLSKENRVQTILDEKSKFYEDYAALDDEPFLQLLAVFYHPTAN